MSKRFKTAIDNGNYNEAAVTLMSLPEDVRVNIASYLTSREIFNLAEINKDFDAWSKTSRNLWIMLYQRNFGDQMPLSQLKNILYATFPDLEKGLFAQDNYRSLVLAYAFVNHTGDWRRTLLNPLTGQEVLLIPSSKEIVMETYKNTGESQQIDENVKNIVLSILTPQSIITKNQYGDFRASFVKILPFLKDMTYFLIAFRIIHRLGYNPKFDYKKPPIKSQCIACSEPAKFKSKETGELFCSEKCANIGMKRKYFYGDEEDFSSEEEPEQKEVFDFEQDLITWLSQYPQRWHGSMSFGDRSFEYSEHIGVQKSFQGRLEGITIQTIGVRPEYRNQGIATRMIVTVERVAQELGKSYVLIQSIMNKEMRRLALKLGYEQMPYGSSDYIKRF